MRRFAGYKRYVFNKALALQKEQLEQDDRLLTYAALCKLLTTWRHDPDTPWLAEAPVHVLQQALRDLMQAFTNAFDNRARLPRKKKKRRGDSFRYPDPKQIHLDQQNGRIRLPKLGWVRYRKSQDVLVVCHVSIFG